MTKFEWISVGIACVALLLSGIAARYTYVLSEKSHELAMPLVVLKTTGAEFAGLTRCCLAIDIIVRATNVRNAKVVVEEIIPGGIRSGSLRPRIVAIQNDPNNVQTPISIAANSWISMRFRYYIRFGGAFAEDYATAMKLAEKTGQRDAGNADLQLKGVKAVELFNALLNKHFKPVIIGDIEIPRFGVEGIGEFYDPVTLHYGCDRPRKYPELCVRTIIVLTSGEYFFTGNKSAVYGSEREGSLHGGRAIGWEPPRKEEPGEKSQERSAWGDK